MPVRVLVAEDEAIIRLDLKEILLDAGYDVVADTGRGDEALELARRLEPDLAILDIKMPGMDGLEVARSLSASRSTAVVVLTAFSQRELIDEANEAGVMGYLVKPFQAEELIPAVEMALGRFTELRALEQANVDLSAQNEVLEVSLENRRIIERAKGKLIDEHSMREADAFAFIQRSAMSRRKTMRQVAEEVLAGDLVPDATSGEPPPKGR